MVASKQETNRIAYDTAERMAKQAAAPADVLSGLAQSMGEELAAGEIYLKRAKHATDKGDCDTARLYQELAAEENRHFEELSARRAKLL